MSTKTRVRQSAARLDYPVRDRLADRVALRLGVKSGTAKQLLYGRHALHIRCAAVIQELRAFGDEHAYGRFIADLLAAMRGADGSGSPAQLSLQAQTADLDEDMAEKAHDLQDNPATLAQLIRAIETEIGAQVERLMLLRAQARGEFQ